MPRGGPRKPGPSEQVGRRGDYIACASRAATTSWHSEKTGEKQAAPFAAAGSYCPTLTGPINRNYKMEPTYSREWSRL
ncbi:hypothetical protein GCM10019017_23790 [Streptomyces showdoensis]